MFSQITIKLANKSHWGSLHSDEMAFLDVRWSGIKNISEGDFFRGWDESWDQIKKVNLGHHGIPKEIQEITPSWAYRNQLEGQTFTLNNRFFKKLSLQPVLALWQTNLFELKKQNPSLAWSLRDNDLRVNETPEKMLRLKKLLFALKLQRHRVLPFQK